jgi:polyphenol oxidase
MNSGLCFLFQSRCCVMHTWSWQTWDGSSFLTCSLLEPWPHGFFTRQTWPQTPEKLVLAVHPAAKSLRVKQVHGNRVLRADMIVEAMGQQPNSEETAWPEADGLMSNAHHQAVWVCSADCTPVLIADSRTGQVAAVHAGWRGTAAKVVPNAVTQMQKDGSAVADLRIAMGPAIAGEVYQVSAEVAAQVGRSILDLGQSLANPDEPDRTLDALMELPNSPVVADEKDGHVRLDVRRINALQLEQMGLEPSQIATAPHCTYQDPENFFSYRRDSRRQVQWSGIVSTDISLSIRSDAINSSLGYGANYGASTARQFS